MLYFKPFYFHEHGDNYIESAKILTLDIERSTFVENSFLKLK